MKRKMLWMLLGVLVLLAALGSCVSDSGDSLPAVSESVETAAPAAPEVLDGSPQGAEAEALQPPTAPEKSTFSVHFIDVGQADAALVECDGHYMLIDGGNKEDSNVIYAVLQNAGAEYLDMVVGTHGHEDHIGGIPGAFSYAAAGTTLCPVTGYDSDAFRDFARYADEKGGGITVPAVGDTYMLGSAGVTILGVNGGDDANDTSIVLKVEYGETSFLFTGDAEREAEQVILDAGADISATVLKVGHHGSETSTTYPFLREVMPEYAVISVGADNGYGHPADNTLSRLRDADVTVYRTDLDGDIVFTSDGTTVTAATERGAADQKIMTAGNEALQPTTEPTPETEPEPEPAVQETLVWIPNSGKKYHSSSGCSGMKNPSQVTVSQAESMGYEPCKKCY